MVQKHFERTILFKERRVGSELRRLPIVTATVFGPGGNGINLPLLFDTGASHITLRRELYSFLGLPSWDSGERVPIAAAGGMADAYRYDDIDVEFFGKRVRCTIQLMELGRHPMFQGLFGRSDIFQEFGFGFWESTRELYITTNP